MASYLTPEWLMSDINQLLSGTRKGLKKYGGDDVLSQADFEDQYYSGRADISSLMNLGEVFAPEQNLGYMYDYDFGDEYSGKRENGKYKFGRQGGAYDAYLSSLGHSPETGYGQGTSNIFDRFVPG